jgi:transcriptional regulator with XRE-family HTH domain
MSVTTLDHSFGEELRRWRLLRHVSQLDLALSAETTQRHLSYIERGLSSPGRALIVRLAESLNLPLRERNALLRRAGYSPVYSERTLDDKDLRAVRDALEAVLRGHEPYPALINNRSGELLSANTACGIFFEDVAEALLTEPINTLRLALHPEGLARRITNFATWAPHVTESVRRECARNPDPTLDQLLEELDSYVAPIPAPAHHLAFAVPMELATRDGTLRLITTLAAFPNASDVVLSEVRLEAFLPADEETAAHLRRRAARTNQTPRTRSAPSSSSSTR